MRPLSLCLLLLSLALSGVACEKDVREVRRSELKPVTPGSGKPSTISYTPADFAASRPASYQM